MPSQPWGSRYGQAIVERWQLHKWPLMVGSRSAHFDKSKVLTVPCLCAVNRALEKTFTEIKLPDLSS